MVADSEGFLFPRIDEDKCVDCQKCMYACPVLQQSAEAVASREVKCYAAYSNDAKILANSSSGGIFSELARGVIGRGGVVVGAAYIDPDLSVKHIPAETIDDLGRLRGSKYVQSSIGDSYQYTLEQLNNGRQVLFSGTPCQIAGLRAYLHADYDNLLLVEVICHGVPSEKLFALTKAEMRKAHGHLEGISFRDKSEGWSRRAITGWYDKLGKIQERGRINDYFSAFIGHLSLRHSCETCRFNAGKSGADITLGDFWGIGEVLPELQCLDAGVSAVIIHSRKGEGFFNLLGCFKYNVELSAITKHNPSYSDVRRPDPRRNLFMEIAFRRGISCAYRSVTRPALSIRLLNRCKRLFNQMQKRSVSPQRTVAIATIAKYFLLSNYGSFFQHYALRTILSRFGYIPFRVPFAHEHSSLTMIIVDTFIDFIRPIYWLGRRRLPEIFPAWRNRLIRDRYYLRFWIEYRLLGINFAEKPLFDGSTLGVRGGDQIFSQYPDEQWLSGIKEGNPIITYAASADWVSLENDQDWREYIRQKLMRYTKVGLREEKGVSLVRGLVPASVDVTKVVDPVELLTANDFKKIQARGRLFKHRTLFCYLVNIETSDDLQLEVLESVADRLQCELKIVSIQGADGVVPKSYSMFLSPRQFLRAVNDSEYYITNSYHGSVFGILYQKKFLSIWQRVRVGRNQNVRQKELMEGLGLADKWLDYRLPAQVYVEKLRTADDWIAVTERLSFERARSLLWLGSALREFEPRSCAVV